MTTKDILFKATLAIHKRTNHCRPHHYGISDMWHVVLNIKHALYIHDDKDKQIQKFRFSCWLFLNTPIDIVCSPYLCSLIYGWCYSQTSFKLCIPLAKGTLNLLRVAGATCNIHFRCALMCVYCEINKFPPHVAIVDMKSGHVAKRSQSSKW